MGVPSVTPGDLKKSLIGMLRSVSRDMGLKLKIDSYGESVIGDIVDCARRLHKAGPVVLVDEYDDPVSSNADNPEKAEAYAVILRDFYAGFKACSDDQRFFFATGVTGYAKAWLSAGMNHLTDITLDPEYAAICGFTHEELDSCFGERYKTASEAVASYRAFLKTREAGMTGDADGGPTSPPGGRVRPRVQAPVLRTGSDLKNEIISWYGGYTWDGVIKVLNPVSVLGFFRNLKFGPYWTDTCPSWNFISNVSRSSPFNFTSDCLGNVPRRDVVSMSPGEAKPVPLMFQTGYLTIDRIGGTDDDVLYHFKVPNSEVKDEYLRILFDVMNRYLKIDVSEAAKKFSMAVMNRDAEALTGFIAHIFASVPAVLRERPSERFYRGVLHSVLYVILGDSRSEVPGAMGNADLVVDLKGIPLTAVMEFEYARADWSKDTDGALLSLAKAALKSVRAKQRWKRRVMAGAAVVTIGVGIYGRGQVSALFGDPEGNELPPYGMKRRKNR
jgi:hypothetical protein